MSGFLSPKHSKAAKIQKVAAFQSFAVANQFNALGPIPQQRSTEDAIALARANVGNYKPEVEESRRLTDLSVSPITGEQIEQYTNPYLKGVLDYTIREMEDAAARRREQRKAIASRSGNDFATHGTINRYQIEDDLADRSMLREIGGVTAQAREGAFDNATIRAENERARQAAGGITYGNYANQTQQLGNADVGMLAAAGEMEAIPEVNKRQHLKDAQGMFSRSVQDLQPSVNEFQKTSLLSQIVGLTGSLEAIANPGNPLGGGPKTNTSPIKGSGVSLQAPPIEGAGHFSSVRGGTGSTQIPSGGGALDQVGNAASGAGILSGIMSFFSDPRLKTDVVRIGTHPIGIGLYKWKYLWGEKSTGVMANEVHKVMPQAITRFMGYDMVNYQMVNGDQNG